MKSGSDPEDASGRLTKNSKPPLLLPQAARHALNFLIWELLARHSLWRISLNKDMRNVWDTASRLHAKFNLPAAPVGVGIDTEHIWQFRASLPKGVVNGANAFQLRASLQFCVGSLRNPIHFSIQIQYKTNCPKKPQSEPP